MNRNWIYSGIAVVALVQPALVQPALAQPELPAIADVQAAVRARAQQFLQLELDKKFRQAEVFVAEDSKDWYYNSNKPSITSFVIDGVDIQEDKTAVVRIHAGFQVVVMGAPPQIFELPSKQTWKLEGGEWKLYVNFGGTTQTPFGKLRVPSDDPSTLGASMPPGFPVRPGVVAPGRATLDNVVATDRNSVVLTKSAPTQTVTVKNGLPGPVDLSVVGSVPHLKIEISKGHLKAGEKGEIAITWKDDVPANSTVRIGVSPLGQELQIESVAQ